MKLQFELNLPDDTNALDVRTLLSEFNYLARARGWRTMVVLPKQPKAPRQGQEDRIQG